MLGTKKTNDINRIHKRKLKHQPQANEVVNNVNQTMAGAGAKTADKTVNGFGKSIDFSHRQCDIDVTKAAKQAKDNKDCRIQCAIYAIYAGYSKEIRIRIRINEDITTSSPSSTPTPTPYCL